MTYWDLFFLLYLFHLIPFPHQVRVSSHPSCLILPPSSFSGSLGSLRAPDLSGHMWALPDLNGERQIAVCTGRQPRAPDLCRINATKNARMNAGKTQKVCQIECQNIYIHILLPDGMSETFRNYFRIIVRVGLTRRK